jgi:hypothetical protein
MLNLITPVSRFDNLKTISRSIPQLPDVHWILVLDSGNPVTIEIQYKGKITIAYGHYNKCNWGHFQRNVGIDLVKDGYIHFLDDDNILHPNLYVVYQQYMKQKRIIIGHQVLKNKSRRLSANLPPKTNKIDIASGLIHIDFLNKIRLNYHYQADGELFENLYKQYAPHFKVVNAPVSYYNYLK